LAAGEKPISIKSGPVKFHMGGISMVYSLSLYGLILNGLGGIALVFYSPPIPPREIMEDGREKIPVSYVTELTPLKGKQRKYYMRQYGFRIGAILLVIGFLLQIIEELSQLV
jgi:hypothetical protein